MREIRERRLLNLWFLVAWAFFTFLSARFSSSAPESSTLGILQLDLAIVSQGGLWAFLMTLPALLLAKTLRSFLPTNGKYVSQVIALVSIVSATAAVMLFRANDKVYDGFRRHIDALMVNQVLQRDFLDQSGIPAEQLWSEGLRLILCIVSITLLWAVLGWVARQNLNVWGRSLATFAFLCIVLEKGVLFVGQSTPLDCRYLGRYIPFYVCPLSDRYGLAEVGAQSQIYPLKTYTGHIARQKNVLFLVFESLSYWAVGPETMPFTYQLGQSGFIGRAHHSGANCTHAGLFSLFYGTNVGWVGISARKKIGSYPLSWLREQGYYREFVSSVGTGWLDLDKHVLIPSFDSVKGISDAVSIDQRDKLLIDRFLSREERANPRPKISALFLNSTHHNYYYDPKFGRHLPVAPNVIDGEMHAYHDAIVNRYKNALLYGDSLVQRVVEDLRSHGELDNTIVIVTGDHGEAFYEHGAYFHSSDLTRSQLGTPLVIYGIEGLRGEMTKPTLHEQILPTVLQALAPDISLSGGGAGRPIGDSEAYPAMASGCIPSYAQDPPDWVAFYPDQKTPFRLQKGRIVAEAPVTLDDNAIPAGSAQPIDEKAVLSKLQPNVTASSAVAASEGEIVARSESCHLLSAGDRALFLCDSPADWARARNWCNAHETKLAEQLSKEELELVSRKLVQLGNPSAAWLGGRVDPKSGHSFWNNGEEISTSWRNDEDPFGMPFKNLHENTGDCVRTSSLFPGRVVRDDCWISWPFVCQGRSNQSAPPQVDTGDLTLEIDVEAVRDWTQGKEALVLYTVADSGTSWLPIGGLDAAVQLESCSSHCSVTLSQLPAGKFTVVVGIIRGDDGDDFHEYFGGREPKVPRSWLRSDPMSISIGSGEVSSIKVQLKRLARTDER